MGTVKNFLRSTPPYEWLRKRRERKAFAQWTARDQEMKEFYAQFVKRDSLCFDVGANLGNRVKIFLALGARVVAVEPQRECAETIERVAGRSQQLTVVQKALGENEGQAELRISDASTLSSMAPDWIDSVRESGRFSENRWDEVRIVQVTTLDRLIEEFELPSFIKIDVEGYEHQVVKGLSRRVECLSLEFVPEYLDGTFRCIDHLQELGTIRLNHTLNEQMKLELDEWVGPREMRSILEAYRDDPTMFGDVYVRCESV